MDGSVDRYVTTQGARWRYRIELPPDPTTGKRRQATRRDFRTKREADRARREAIADVDDGTHIPSSRLTVGAWLEEEWLPSIRPRSAEVGRRHRGTVSAATHDRYAGDLRRYVIPRIGSVQLQALTAAMLDGLYDELERAGGRGGRPLSSKTVANVAGALHKALADAVKRGRIKAQPSRRRLATDTRGHAHELVVDRGAANLPPLRRGGRAVRGLAAVRDDGSARWRGRRAHLGRSRLRCRVDAGRLDARARRPHADVEATPQEPRRRADDGARPGHGRRATPAQARPSRGEAAGWTGLAGHVHRLPGPGAIRTRVDVRRRLADPPEDALRAVPRTVSRSRAAPDQTA